MRRLILLFLCVVRSRMEETADDGLSIGMQELEFLSEELTMYECRELSKTQDFEKRAEDGENCLDLLVRYHGELMAEGPDVVQSVFRHKLAQIGRRDLADWLSRPRVGNTKASGTPQQRFSVDVVRDDSDEANNRWTYIDFAICTLATWAFLTLAWLVIQLILIDMKATAIASVM